MPLIEVDAYDPRYSRHEEYMEFECNTGLDIELLPDFVEEIEVDIDELEDGDEVVA